MRSDKEGADLAGGAIKCVFYGRLSETCAPNGCFIARGRAWATQ